MHSEHIALVAKQSMHLKIAFEAGSVAPALPASFEHAQGWPTAEPEQEANIAFCRSSKKGSNAFMVTDAP
jgi:hypothetical protein